MRASADRDQRERRRGRSRPARQRHRGQAVLLREELDQLILGDEPCRASTLPSFSFERRCSRSASAAGARDEPLATSRSPRARAGRPLAGRGVRASARRRPGRTTQGSSSTAGRDGRRALAGPSRRAPAALASRRSAGRRAAARRPAADARAGWDRGGGAAEPAREPSAAARGGRDERSVSCTRLRVACRSRRAISSAGSSSALASTIISKTTGGRAELALLVAGERGALSAAPIGQASARSRSPRRRQESGVPANSPTRLGRAAARLGQHDADALARVLGEQAHHPHRRALVEDGDQDGVVVHRRDVDRLL